MTEHTGTIVLNRTQKQKEIWFGQFRFGFTLERFNVGSLRVAKSTRLGTHNIYAKTNYRPDMQVLFGRLEKVLSAS